MSVTSRNETKMLNKVPEVTIWFWIIKVLATTVGETAADFINSTLRLGLTGTSLVMGLMLGVFLVMQVRARAYVPWLYWATVVLISVVGTLASDNLVDNLKLPLTDATLLFGLALAVTFVCWHWREQTLSIREIVTRRKELFYWAAILFTFALGTAGGDLAAEGLNLGYATAAFSFALAIVMVILARYLLAANDVMAFWAAYILTRPLGASCGDLLSQSPADGGLGLGTMATSVVFLSVILALVVYLTATQRREPLLPAPAEVEVDQGVDFWSN
ncbi:MAG: hypothetical protein M0T76_09910 [Desulfobacteraceae bacterium]|nr:hypothetical protein [Desulfobacteraceae bacterium]